MNIISKRKVKKYKDTHKSYIKCLCYNCYYTFCCFMLSNNKNKCKVYKDDGVSLPKYKRSLFNKIQKENKTKD